MNPNWTLVNICPMCLTSRWYSENEDRYHGGCDCCKTTVFDDKDDEGTES